MKAFTISTALALLTSLASAAPAAIQPEVRQFQTSITFIGAADGVFHQTVPTDGSFSISNPLSVSKIQSDGGAVCSFYGIDGSFTQVVGAETVDVGPPQTQVYGHCSAF